MAVAESFLQCIVEGFWHQFWTQSVCVSERAAFLKALHWREMMHQRGQMWTEGQQEGKPEPT